jgi:hypothetical protein
MRTVRIGAMEKRRGHAIAVELGVPLFSVVVHLARRLERDCGGGRRRWWKGRNGTLHPHGFGLSSRDLCGIASIACDAAIVIRQALPHADAGRAIIAR